MSEVALFEMLPIAPRLELENYLLVSFGTRIGIKQATAAAHGLLLKHGAIEARCGRCGCCPQHWDCLGIGQWPRHHSPDGMGMSQHLDGVN